MLSLKRVRFFVCCILVLSISMNINAEKKPDKDFYFTTPILKTSNFFPEKCLTKNIGGENISPALNWKNAPKNAEYFAFSCIDTKPIANNWVHWMVINIPKDINKLPRNASGTKDMPVKSEEFENSFGWKGYGGPQPPKGTGVHKYEFTIYALKEKIVTEKKAMSYNEFKELLKNKYLKKSSFFLKASPNRK